MNKPSDDLQAVRILVEALEKFEAKDQERIIRWAREKLGLPIDTKSSVMREEPSEDMSTKLPTHSVPGSSKATDIKTFVLSKNPVSDKHFVATVAYYYRFEAPVEKRKDSITWEDLQEACRTTGRDRFKRPDQTLVNAHHAGLLDKAERGAYSINTVGENLVAMTLPNDQTKASSKKKTRRTSKKK